MCFSSLLLISPVHRRGIDKHMNQLPFAVVPPSLRPTFDFLNDFAVFSCGMTTQVIGREKKPLVTFLTRDAIFFAKKEYGALARRVLFSSIRSIHTNIGPGGSVAKNAEAFVVMLLSPQERTDLVLVGSMCVEFLGSFKAVWAATGFAGRCPFEENPSLWKSFTELKQNYRVPQSSREGNPTMANVEKRSAAEARRADTNEAALLQDFPDDAGSPSAGLGSSRKSSPRMVRAVTFRDPVTGTESPSMVLVSDPTSFNQQVELPYVHFASDESAAFPTMSRRDAAMFYCERLHLFQPAGSAVSTAGNRFVSGSVVDCFAVLSTTHLYCAVSEDRVLRCSPLNKIAKLWWVRDVSDAEFTATSLGQFDKSAAHAVLIQFQEVAQSHHAVGRPNSPSVVREEHDILLVFSTEEKMKRFSGILEQILTKAHATNGSKFAQSANLSLTVPLLAPREGFQVAPVPLPSKLDAKSSEELRRAKSAAGGSTASPTLARHGSMDSSGSVQRQQSTLRRQSSMGFLLGSPEPETYTGLMSIVRDDPQLLEEFPVSAELRERHPPLATGSVHWAGRVVFHPAPLRKQAGQRSSELMVAFITRSQFVVGNNGQHLRILPVTSITSIRVKTIPRKSGEHNRQVIVLVGDKVEHDLCVELDREDEGRVMLNQLLFVLKRIDPYNIPAIRSFHDVEAENFRFEPNKFYSPPALDLPVSFDTLAYRREIKQRALNLYKKHKPDKIDRVESLCKEYEGKELQLLEKLRSKFGNDVDQVNDDLFGYRKRLVAFCERYLPESIDMVDRVLREYRGQETRMFEILVKRFGPEPKEPIVTPAAKQAALQRERSRARLVTENPRTRLTRIYTKYQPSKLGVIDEILQRYKGEEEVLFRKLEKLYGPEPEPEEPTASAPQAGAKSESHSGGEVDYASVFDTISYAERITAMCKRYTPSKINTIPSVLQQFKGRERELLDGLVKKYGPEPIPCVPETRARLAGFFANHLPEKMSDDKLNEILSAFRGTEKDLYESLVKRYGATGPYTPKTEPPKGGVAPPARKPGQVIASSSDDEDDGVKNGSFATFNADGSPAAREAVNRRAGNMKNAAKEDRLEEMTLQRIDMLTELPFVEVPAQVTHLFPSFAQAAIFTFERVLHWEPGTPPALRYLYATSTHIYIASAETTVHRCIAIRDLQCVYITTKREDVDAQCSVLLKLYPKEHDCFFTLENDFDAKRFVWILLEIQHKHLRGQAPCHVFPVASLLEEGIDPHCKRAESFELIVEPVRRRKRQLNSYSEAAMASVTVQELFSRLHEAVIERRDDSAIDALSQVRDAALSSRPTRSLLELSSKDRKVYGNGGSMRSPAVQMPRGGGDTNDSIAASYAPTVQGSQFHHTTARDGPVTSFVHKGRGDDLSTLDDDATRRRKLNPIQRQQFFQHSFSGLFGTATSGRVLDAANPEEESRYPVGMEPPPGVAAGGDFAEIDAAGNNDASKKKGSAMDADAGVRSGEGLQDAPKNDDEAVDEEARLVAAGTLGISEVFKPSPWDASPTPPSASSAGARGGWATPAVPAGVRTTAQYGASSYRGAKGSPATPPPQPYEAYANAAVAPPPHVQRALYNTSQYTQLTPARPPLSDFPELGANSPSFRVRYPVTPDGYVVDAPTQSGSRRKADPFSPSGAGSLQYKKFLLNTVL